jgi:rubrerythrin
MKKDNGNRNKTGMAISPLADEMLSAVSDADHTPGTALAEVRINYAAAADPIGTMPPPGTLKELGTTAVKMLTGKRAPVFLDKLGERLGFERTGTRLYEGVLSKFDSSGTWKGGPTREQLMQIHAEELVHFRLLEEVISSLGGDPTAVTPSANLHAVASKGLCAVISDPRTDLRESLEAALIAELADNDCWQTLVALANGFGREDLAAQFTEALEHEQEHLSLVRGWLGSALSFNALGKMDPAFVAISEEAVASRAGSSDGRVGTVNPDNGGSMGRKAKPSRPTRGSDRSKVRR